MTYDKQDLSFRAFLSRIHLHLRVMNGLIIFLTPLVLLIGKASLPVELWVLLIPYFLFGISWFTYGLWCVWENV